MLNYVNCSFKLQVISQVKTRVILLREFEGNWLKELKWEGKGRSSLDSFKHLYRVSELIIMHELDGYVIL